MSARTLDPRKTKRLDGPEWRHLLVGFDEALWQRLLAWRRTGGHVAPLVRKLLSEYLDREAGRPK